MLPDRIDFIEDRKRGMLTFAMILLEKIMYFKLLPTLFL